MEWRGRGSPPYTTWKVAALVSAAGFPEKVDGSLLSVKAIASAKEARHETTLRNDNTKHSPERPEFTHERSHRGFAFGRYLAMRRETVREPRAEEWRRWGSVAMTNPPPQLALSCTFRASGGGIAEDVA